MKRAAPSFKYAKTSSLPGSDGCTAFHVGRLSRTLVRLYDRHMQASGVTIGQFAVLRGLRRTTLSSGELARLIGIDRTTLTRTLHPLLEAGWVIKTTGTDARQRVLELSESGLERYRLARTAWRQAQGAVEDAIGTQKIREFHAVAASIGARLELTLSADID